MNKREVEFKYGALANYLEVQANAQGFTLGDKAAQLEDLKQSIALLFTFGILTETEKSKAVKRLHKKVIATIKPKEYKPTMEEFMYGAEGSEIDGSL